MVYLKIIYLWKKLNFINYGIHKSIGGNVIRGAKGFFL